MKEDAMRRGGKDFELNSGECAVARADKRQRKRISSVNRYRGDKVMH